MRGDEMDSTGSGWKQVAGFYFNTLYRASFFILYNDQQMHNSLTNYHTPTCFDTIVSSSGSL